MGGCLGYRTVGVVHGRFQPYHLGHFRYTSIVYDLVDKLIIGITNPDPSYTRYDIVEPKRHLPVHNPFTYYERYLMIKETLLKNNFDMKKIDIVPFPINIPEIIEYYIPKCAIHYIVNYEKWSLRKKSILEELGYKVILLGKHEYIDIKGEKIRKLMAEGKPWEQYVPEPASKIIKRLGLEIRVRELLREHNVH